MDAIAEDELQFCLDEDTFPALPGDASPRSSSLGSRKISTSISPRKPDIVLSSTPSGLPRTESMVSIDDTKEFNASNLVPSEGNEEAIYEMIHSPRLGTHSPFPTLDSMPDLIIEATEVSCDDNVIPTIDNSDLPPASPILKKQVSTCEIGPRDFCLKSVIGQGAYGKVFLVEHKAAQNFYAMKVLQKGFILKKKNSEYVREERNILCRVDHPFVVKLHFAFQSEFKLYLVMEFVSGGELFNHLRNVGLFMEEEAKFYTAEIVLAIEYLHQNNIIHRDLKPENVLLDELGHLRLTDFGLAKVSLSDSHRSKTICGTDLYMAPEMLAGTGYGKAVDWWSLGTLMFEMLTGDTPFYANNTKKLYKKIMNEKPKYPRYLSAACHQMLKGLLNRNVEERMGAAKSTMFKIRGVQELKQHAFFKGFNWQKLFDKELIPPIRPKFNCTTDTSNFNDKYTNMHFDRKMSNIDDAIGEDKDDRHCQKEENVDVFAGFSYVRPQTLLSYAAIVNHKSIVEEEGSASAAGTEVSSHPVSTDTHVAKTQPKFESSKQTSTASKVDAPTKQKADSRAAAATTRVESSKQTSTASKVDAPTKQKADSRAATATTKVESSKQTSTASKVDAPTKQKADSRAATATTKVESSRPTDAAAKADAPTKQKADSRAATATTKVESSRPTDAAAKADAPTKQKADSRAATATTKVESSRPTDAAAKADAPTKQKADSMSSSADGTASTGVDAKNQGSRVGGSTHAAPRHTNSSKHRPKKYNNRPKFDRIPRPPPYYPPNCFDDPRRPINHNSTPYQQYPPVYQQPNMYGYAPQVAFGQPSAYPMMAPVPVAGTWQQQPLGAAAAPRTKTNLNASAKEWKPT